MLGEERYYNPDPLYHLIGPANETEVQVEGQSMKALIDSGAQISAISESMVKTLGLPSWQLHTLLHLEGAAGLDVPYLGYTELRLDMPEVKRFDNDCLLMIYPDSKYSHRVPIIIGTLHIDEVLDLATEEELSSLSQGWKRGVVGWKLVAKQIQLAGKGEPMIQRIDSEARLTKNLVLPPRQASKTMGLARIPVLRKRINVATDISVELDRPEVELLPGFESMKPGSSRVAVALFNNCQEKVTLRKGMVVARILAANVNPPMLAPSSGTYQNIPEFCNATKGNDAKNGYIPETKENITCKPEPTPE